MILHERPTDFWSSEAVALVYCAMFCYTLKCVIWRSPDYTRLYTLYTRLVCMGSLLRVVYFGIPDWVWGVPFVPTNFVRFGHAWWGNFVSFVVLMCMGNVFFYLSFVLLVYYWASVCEDSKAVPARLFKVVTGTFIAFYIFVVAFYFVGGRFTQQLFVYSIMQAVFALVLLVLYAWYATRIVRLLSPTWSTNGSLINSRESSQDSRRQSPPWEAQHRHHTTILSSRMWRITSVAGVVLVCELVRGGMLSYQAVLAFQVWDAHEGQLHWSSAWWIVVTLFYIVCEIGCTAAVLMIMRPKAKLASPLLHTRTERADSDYASTGL